MNIYKQCPSCAMSRLTTEFHKNARNKDGLCVQCKICVFRAQRIRRDRDPDAPLHARDSRILLETTWRQRNPGYYLAKAAERKAYKISATPIWLTSEHKQQIVELYNLARRTNMHVDHIVPLKGKNVCGLHVPWNLQLLTPTENMKKSNKFN